MLIFNFLVVGIIALDKPIDRKQAANFLRYHRANKEKRLVFPSLIFTSNLKENSPLGLV